MRSGLKYHVCTTNAVAAARRAIAAAIDQCAAAPVAGSSVMERPPLWFEGALPRASAAAQLPYERAEPAAHPRQRSGHRVEIAPVDVAPAPLLPALERRDHGMAGGIEMLQGMRMARVLAAADVAAREADAQLGPGRSDREAALAAACA